MTALRKRNDETDLQFQSRRANLRAQGEGRDVINPFRQQHDDFEPTSVRDEHGRAHRVLAKTVQIVKMKDQLRINDSELKALLLYKQDWHTCDRSLTRDSCDFSVRGGDGSGISPKQAAAAIRLENAQAAIHKVCKLDMFESIVCYDNSPTKTARAFFCHANGCNLDIVRRNFERGVTQCKPFYVK